MPLPLTPRQCPHCLSLAPWAPQPTTRPGLQRHPANTTPTLCNCDTGEPLPKKLIEKIQKGEFVKLHKFLSKPHAGNHQAPGRVFLQLLPQSCPRSTTHYAHSGQHLHLDALPTVAAVATVRAPMVSGILAHANTVLSRRRNSWRVYDRAFCRRPVLHLELGLPEPPPPCQHVHGDGEEEERRFCFSLDHHSQ